MRHAVNGPTPRSPQPTAAIRRIVLRQSVLWRVPPPATSDKARPASECRCCPAAFRRSGHAAGWPPLPLGPITASFTGAARNGCCRVSRPPWLVRLTPSTWRMLRTEFITHQLLYYNISIFLPRLRAFCKSESQRSSRTRCVNRGGTKPRPASTLRGQNNIAHPSINDNDFHYH